MTDLPWYRCEPTGTSSTTPEPDNPSDGELPNYLGWLPSCSRRHGKAAACADTTKYNCDGDFLPTFQSKNGQTKNYCGPLWGDWHGPNGACCTTGKISSKVTTTTIAANTATKCQQKYSNGLCQDTNKYKCKVSLNPERLSNSAGYVDGLCPGAANIKCCPYEPPEKGESCGRPTWVKSPLAPWAPDTGVCTDATKFTCGSTGAGAFVTSWERQHPVTRKLVRRSCAAELKCCVQTGADKGACPKALPPCRAAGGTCYDASPGSTLVCKDNKLAPGFGVAFEDYDCSGKYFYRSRGITPYCEGDGQACCLTGFGYGGIQPACKVAHEDLGYFSQDFWEGATCGDPKISSCVDLDSQKKINFWEKGLRMYYSDLSPKTTEVKKSMQQGTVLCKGIAQCCPGFLAPLRDSTSTATTLALTVCQDPKQPCDCEQNSGTCFDNDDSKGLLCTSVFGPRYNPMPGASMCGWGRPPGDHRCCLGVVRTECEVLPNGGACGDPTKEICVRGIRQVPVPFGALSQSVGRALCPGYQKCCQGLVGETFGLVPKKPKTTPPPTPPPTTTTTLSPETCAAKYTTDQTFGRCYDEAWKECSVPAQRNAGLCPPSKSQIR